VAVLDLDLTDGEIAGFEALHARQLPDGNANSTRPRVRPVTDGAADLFASYRTRPSKADRKERCVGYPRQVMSSLRHVWPVGEPSAEPYCGCVARSRRPVALAAW
jgi:hypothetical protein